VWLDRTGPALANDAIILERLALAVRIRHGRGRREPENRRDLGLLLDPAVDAETRMTVAARLSLAPASRYRIVAAPLFAVWESHPSGPEDVVATPFGPIHALVLPHDHEPVRATPTGIGHAATPEHLPQSFRSAIVALRLCEPPATPSVEADRYGGLVGLLADTSDDTAPDVDLLDDVMAHPWGAVTLDALVRAGSVRQAARLAGVHHSTLQTRLDSVVATLGFDPFDGIGRTRLGIAFLMWRLRNSRVLDLPAPGAGRRTS
jgi:methyl acetate hydrolase